LIAIDVTEREERTVPIYYPDVLEEHSEPKDFTYTAQEVMLYALGIGMGENPMDAAELPFVYEKNLKVVPSAATVLHTRIGRPPMVGRSPNHRSSNVNYTLVVHGEQIIELHRPLPTSGSFTTVTRTIGAFDKGAGKGALIVNETTWTDQTGELVATLTSTTFARGDGGFGGPAEGGPQPHAVPDREPDATAEFCTRPGQALLYRLNGDRNPLHADPDVARQAGFARPILHGLCTYGITCRAVLKEMVGNSPEQILSHQVRFSAPVLPGDTLVVDLWRDGTVVSFQARAKERDVTVIKNGKTVLRG
jgi:acyl dehydratase